MKTNNKQSHPLNKLPLILITICTLIACADMTALANPDIVFGGCNVVGFPGLVDNRILSVDLGDLDGDGDLDMVSGDWDEQVVIWQNDGTPFTGQWPSVVLYTGTTTEDINGVAFGNFDGDADLDIVSVGDDGHFVLWENDGTPFTGPWNSNSLDHGDNDIDRVAVGNLDGDADLDIVIGDGPNNFIVWENDGTPFTGNWSSNLVGTALGDIYALALGDFDGVNGLDIVSNGGDYNTVIWQNDGTPFSGTWASTEIDSIEADEYVYSVAVGDLDGDNDLDIVGGIGDYTVLVWQNDGTPFTGAWAPTVAGTRSDDIAAVAVGDLDGDNDLDIVSGDGGNDVITWENDGTPFNGGWIPAIVSSQVYEVGWVGTGDLDLDGDLDIVSAQDDWGDDDNRITACRNATPAMSVPTMSELGLICLAAMMILTALHFLRKKNHLF